MASTSLIRHNDPRRLRRVLAAFFVALALPTAVLVWQAYARLEFETFFQYRRQAEALTNQIDSQLGAAANRLDNLSLEDFRFVTGSGNVYQRSPLSTLPIRSDLPGVVGYFQIDASGNLTTPLLPAAGTASGEVGLAPENLEERRVVESRIRSILAGNAPADAGADDRTEAQEERIDGAAADASGSLSVVLPEAERAFADAPARQTANRYGQLDELDLDEGLQQKSEQFEQRIAEDMAEPALERRRVERESPSAPRIATAPASMDSDSEAALDTFARNLDGFELSLLDSGHLVLFRSAWDGEQRLVQGMLVDTETFYTGAVETVFRGSSLAAMSDLVIGFQNEVLAVLRAQQTRGYSTTASELQGDLLHRSRLTAPFDELELVFSITQLPSGPAGRVLAWTTLVIALVILGGLYALYRLGLKQILLAQQQQDFVSAVSHELKTPLTSIRMYGEMLKEGWADDEKRQQYYDYIHAESERLSRLISNVLQLARITRNEPQFDLQTCSVAELLDQIHSKISSQVEQAGFDLEIVADDDCGSAKVHLDADCFAQIVINLVDNAIKFSANADLRHIAIGCSTTDADNVLFTVRDHGPGIPGDQLEKIFRLFYRSESELTRETVGTGIGLAIVHELATAMGGTVDVINRNPGAEFRVSFPRATDR